MRDGGRIGALALALAFRCFEVESLVGAGGIGVDLAI